MGMEKCPKCGSTEIDKGKITSTSLSPMYVSAKQKMFSKTPRIEVFLCLQCEYLESYTDPETARKNING